MGSSGPVNQNDGTRVASLSTINFALLERKDNSEIKKLLSVSSCPGFFYLDFTSSEAESLPTRKMDVLQVMEKYFGQSSDEKILDSRGSTTRG